MSLFLYTINKYICVVYVLKKVNLFNISDMIYMYIFNSRITEKFTNKYRHPNIMELIGFEINYSLYDEYSFK